MARSSLHLASRFHRNNFFKQYMAIVTYPDNLMTGFEQFEMGERFAEHEPVIKGILARGKRAARHSRDR
jgi:hypothetical protein